MPSNSVEKIKEKLDITEVVGSYIKLQKAGASYKAKCPFHNEKTPPFFVSPGRGTYYCFGCGAKGDIFTFVEELEGLDFLGALRLLADRAGIELEKIDPKARSEKDKLYEIMELASKYFEENLAKNQKAMQYLNQRGFEKETVKLWRLGYAENEWRNLQNHLSVLRVNDNEMLKCGLIKKSEQSKEGFYDVFRGRIMFPIFDQNGRIIAFSGRIFDDVPDAPKYINSPETELFNKSETLYGFDRAKTEIRKKDYSILVEGQMDLIACHQAGFTNTVASSGTAFTEGHLLKLKKLSNKIMFVFDADKAGFLAANKSAVLALDLGMEVKLASLPKGSDPAQLLKDDALNFKACLRNSRHLIDFYLDDLLAQRVEGRKLAKEVGEKVLPYVGKLTSAIEQSHFVSQISKKTSIPEEAIWFDLRKLKYVQTDNLKKEKVTTATEIKKRKNHIERRLLGIILWQREEKSKIIDESKILDRLKEITGKIVSDFPEAEGNREELIFEAENYYEGRENLEMEVEELLNNLKEDILREKFIETMHALDQAEKKKDGKKSKELLNLCQEITKELSELAVKRL